MKNSLFITNSRLIHSPYVPEQCLTLIKSLIVNALYGEYSISCGGVTRRPEHPRKPGLYYNSFAPAVNIDISQAEHGSEIDMSFEINRTVKRFSKFFYSLLIVLELILVACETMTGAISNVPLLLLPLEMLLVCHAVLTIGFAIAFKRHAKKFDEVLCK